MTFSKFFGLILGTFLNSVEGREKNLRLAPETGGLR